uniref:Uncharacterized protein n=1 Tax=Glossina pallidipes TaxID=7398 RepID=A0A1A9ZCZ0_GLOPL
MTETPLGSTVPNRSQLYPHNVINSAIVFSSSNSSSSSYISSSPLSSNSISVDSPPDAFALTLGLSSVGCKSLAANELESNSECDSVLSELVAELEREGPGCSLSNKVVDDVLEPGKASEDVPVDVIDGMMIGFSSVDSFVVVDLSPPKPGNILYFNSFQSSQSKLSTMFVLSQPTWRCDKWLNSRLSAIQRDVLTSPFNSLFPNVHSWLFSGSNPIPSSSSSSSITSPCDSNSSFSSIPVSLALKLLKAQ